MTRKNAERQEAIERLREMLKPGDTVYTILRHVSRSGMSRVIDCYTKDHQWIGYRVALVTESKYDDKQRGVRIGGCGMDMGFALVYDLSWVLFGRNNPNRSDNDGGYALKQEWL